MLFRSCLLPLVSCRCGRFHRMQMPEAPRRAPVSTAAPRPAPRYVQFTAQPAKRQAENRPARRGIVAFPSRLYDISHKTGGEERAQWPRKMAHILFYKFYLSGRPCVFCKGPICLPNETLAGREPSLLRPGLGLHRRALHQRRWRPDRKSTRLNSSHKVQSRMPSSA